MVSPSTALTASATVVASILGSLTVVEYRVYRESQIEEYRQKQKWYRRMAVLADQIEREATDLQGYVGEELEQLYEQGVLDPLEERIQELKLHISDAPLELDDNLKFVADDVWVKYAVAKSGGDLEMSDLEEYLIPAADRCHENFQSAAEDIEPPNRTDALRFF